MPAEADAPAPRNHIQLAERRENRRAKSSAPISGSFVTTSISIAYHVPLRLQPRPESHLDMLTQVTLQHRGTQQEVRLTHYSIEHALVRGVSP